MPAPSSLFSASILLVFFLTAAFGGTTPPKKSETGDCRVERIAGNAGDSLYVLSNNLVRAKVSSKTGRLLSLEDGKDRPFLKIGILDYNWEDARGGKKFGSPDGGETRIVRNDSSGVSIETVFSPKENFPCTVTIRYTALEKIPGVYAECRFTHAKEAPAFTLEQLRFCFFADPDMGLYGRTATRSQLLPSAKALDEAIPLRPKEAMWMSNSIIDCKYDWTLFSAERGVYGVHSDNRGLWLLEASQEYVNGGPEKQTLSLHPTPSPLAAPVLLAMFHSRHFQDGTLSMLPVSQGEAWSKTFGPVLLLLANGTPDEQWNEACTRQKAETSMWPYPWEQTAKRVKVTGRILSPGGEPSGGVRILLADSVEPGLEPVISAQFVGKMPWFSTVTKADGTFELEKVLPGRYTLYAWKDGLWESVRKDGIDVPEGGTEIEPVLFPVETSQNRLWQIGIPDRDGREFFRGDGQRHFGRHLSYRNDFPDGLTFDVRKDDCQTRWNWAMLPVPQVNGGFKPSTWNVLFGGKEKRSGRAQLTVSLATSSTGTEPLVFRLNGTEIGKLPLRADTALWFGATRGNVQTCRFPFDAALLRTDENKLTIENANKSVFSGVVWDALKMEYLPSSEAAAQ